MYSYQSGMCSEFGLLVFCELNFPCFKLRWSRCLCFFFFKQTCANVNNFAVRCREFPPFPVKCLPTERWLPGSCLNTTLQLHTYDLELIPNPAAQLLVPPDCTHPDPEAGIDPCPYSTRSCPHSPASIKTSCSGLIIIFCGQLAPG